MDKIRLSTIINNLLAEIVNATEIDEETYFSWLRIEIGITDDEIKELKEAGLLPVPID